jgi:hypothetical protein
VNLSDWAESVFGVVEQDGATAFRVRLITPTNGDVWATWLQPFPEPSAWQVAAESVLRGLEQQFGGRHQLSFVAETKTGEQTAQLPWRITGKLASGNLESAQQAAASTFASLAATMERIQELANVQLENARKQVEQQSQWSHQLMGVVRAYRETTIAEGNGEASASPIQALFLENLPKIMQGAELMVGAWMQQQAQKTERKQPTVHPQEQARTTVAPSYEAPRPAARPESRPAARPAPKPAPKAAAKPAKRAKPKQLPPPAKRPKPKRRTIVKR